MSIDPSNGKMTLVQVPIIPPTNLELVSHNETMTMKNVLPGNVYRLNFVHPSEKITVSGLPPSIQFHILYDWCMPSKNYSENHQFIWQNGKFWLDGKMINMGEISSLDVREKYFEEKSAQIQSMMVEVDRPYIVFVNTDRERYPFSENFSNLEITITNHSYNLKSGDYYKYCWTVLTKAETL